MRLQPLASDDPRDVVRALRGAVLAQDAFRLAALTPLLAAIAENAARHDRAASFPHDSLALLHRAGVSALTVPVALGGGGARRHGLVADVDHPRRARFVEVGQCHPTSARVAANHVQREHPGARVLSVGSRALGEELVRVGLVLVEDPLAADVVVQGFAPGTTAADLGRAVVAVRGLHRFALAEGVVAQDVTAGSDEPLAPAPRRSVDGLSASTSKAYSSLMPSRPVKPWQMTLVFLFTRIDMVAP